MSNGKLKPNASGKYEGDILRCWVKKEGEDYGKSYIIHTTNLKDKKRLWNQPGSKVGGKKIMDAREKYDPVKDWQVDHLETITKDNEGELMDELKKRHTYYIDEFDSIKNGYNTCHGGTGNRDVVFSPEWCDKISKNHRHYQSEETVKKISKKLKGRKRSPEECAKISAGLKGKPKNEAAKQSMSACRKGKEPKAASEAAAKKREELGHGFNKGIKLKNTDNMIRAQRDKNARAVKVTEKDDTVNFFETRTDAAKYYGVKPGCITSYIKTGKPTKKWGNVFEDISKDEYNALKSIVPHVDSPSTPTP